MAQSFFLNQNVMFNGERAARGLLRNYIKDCPSKKEGFRVCFRVWMKDKSKINK
jgi:hypothetical protein